MSRQTFKVLDENVIIEVDGKLIKTTAILAAVAGGKRVNYVDDNGNIIQTAKFSQSPYRDKSKDQPKK